jgi:hypothetical protein
MKIILPFTAALLLCAVFGAARAEQLYEPPPGADAVVLVPSLREQQREQAADRALAERRQKMIEECEQNHGSEMDCEREADTELRAEGLQSGVRAIRIRPPG